MELEVGTKLIKLSRHIDSQGNRGYKTEYTIKANNKVYVLTYTDKDGTLVERRVPKDEIFKVKSDTRFPYISAYVFSLEDKVYLAEYDLNIFIIKKIDAFKNMLDNLYKNSQKTTEYED